MSKESKVLRKMEYMEKMKRRQRIKGFVFDAMTLFSIFLGLWYLFAKMLGREPTVKGMIQPPEEVCVETALLLVAMVFALIMVISTKEEEIKKTEGKIAEFEELLRKEEFFQYLGEKEMEVELQLEFLKAPSDFEKAIRNPRVKYFVQKEGMDSLYMTAYKGSKKIWGGTVDYEFFALYFIMKRKNIN